ncbi:unnamed protein product, partial [Mesorhabditis belari]|uniref:Intraflagellar transport protein 122 homolog n=1 Tax=Mesorhabditis belari TaxID=2138241 RepID=A0AAF3J966_9BILA
MWPQFWCCIYDLAFKPDGSELLVAADTRILIYDGVDGTLLQSLKGHKDLVYCVTWSHDGERFASGSADKSVILWTEQHEGTLKYNHVEAIQCLCFSPITQLLLSCALSDFGIWSSVEKNVAKQRVAGRATAAAWSCDGSLFAIATFEGNVFLKKTHNVLSNETTQQEQHVKIERPGGEPIWAIAFSPPKMVDDSGNRFSDQPTGEILCVTDWARSLSFYDLEGNKVNTRERELSYDPTCAEYFNGGQFLVVGGSNKHVLLYTRMGINLGIVSQMDTWVWSVTVKPNSNTIVAGCVDGTLACYQLMFSTVHGLHNERYAYRENMTDVVVQHLSRHTLARIKCFDLVKKVAIYNHKLAIQLSDRVNIYKQVSGDRGGEPLEYKLVDKISKAFECSLLVVCARHILLCSDRRLECFDHKGLRQREWILDAHIRYIKVIGGPPGRETILVGLKNGQVNKLFVDNPFPVEMLKLSAPVRCIDISLNRKQLAIVDENGVAMVFNAKNKDLIFQEPNCNSIAFNTQYEHLLCYSGNGILTLRAGTLPGSTQRMMGFVVGFSGNKVFCLHMYAMSAVEVSFSNHLLQYMERKDFKFVT